MAAVYDVQAAPYHEPLACRVVELAEPRTDGRVLDIGCGTGVATLEAARRIGENGLAIGIDLAGGAVRVAAVRATASGVRNARFAIMDARLLSFPDARLGTVVSCLGHPVVGRD